MVVVAKMEDGRIVEVRRVAETVGFFKDTGWVCICFDVGMMRSVAVKWVPIATRFVWVREFEFGG